MLMSAIVMVCLMVGVSNTVSAQAQKKATDFVKKSENIQKFDKADRTAKIAATKQKIQQKKGKTTAPKNLKNSAVELNLDNVPNRKFDKQVISPNIRQMTSRTARKQEVIQRIQNNRSLNN